MGGLCNQSHQLVTSQAANTELYKYFSLFIANNLTQPSPHWKQWNFGSSWNEPIKLPTHNKKLGLTHLGGFFAFAEDNHLRRPYKVSFQLNPKMSTNHFSCHHLDFSFWLKKQINVKACKIYIVPTSKTLLDTIHY